MHEHAALRRDPRALSEQAASTRPATQTSRAARVPWTAKRSAAELAAIRDRVAPSSASAMRATFAAIVALQRTAEVAGRGLLFAGTVAAAWVAGVALLSLSKVLENMEIGHNVLHGQYDWMSDPGADRARVTSGTGPAPRAHWRHSHNFVHHTFTNIVGKDRDVGYGLLRMADEQPWHPANLPQPLYALLQMLTFEWAVAVHDLELDARARQGGRPCAISGVDRGRCATKRCAS